MCREETKVQMQDFLRLLLLLKNIALNTGSNFERDFLAILYFSLTGTDLSPTGNLLLINFTVHGEPERLLLSELEGKIPVQVASKQV